MGKGNRFDSAMGVLERYGGKLQSMTYLVAIKDAFMDLMPIIIGSFATLINNVICSTSNGLAQFAGFEFLSQFSGIFSAINYATMNFLAIYLVYRLGHRMAKIRETGSAVLSGFVALACYMSLVPTTASASSAAGEAVSISNVVASGYTNSQGMFMALIFGVIGFVFQKLTGQYVPDFITATLQAPMEGIMQHPAGVIVLALICQAFWMVGIHGSQMIGVVRNTIGLIVAIFLFSKREDNKAIAKLSAVPAIFGINEPMIFGMPIVLNPLLAIPFVLAPMITAAIGYVATATGFAGAAMITQIICIIVSILIYIPFVKLLNRQQEA